jgi:hypothetical protein
MDEARRITEPSLLSDITIGLSNLSIETSGPSQLSQIQQATLVLLQPLANADMLATCRNPDSQVVRKPDGSACGTSNHEYLNIKSLSVAWRQAVVKAPPISEITFDLALPKPEEDGKITGNAFKKVYWDTAMPQGGGLAVHTRDVMTLAVTIATGTRMRADGELRFRVTYDESDGVSLRAMKQLEKQLLALGPEYKTPVKHNERRDGESSDQDGRE